MVWNKNHSIIIQRYFKLLLNGLSVIVKALAYGLNEDFNITFLVSNYCSGRKSLAYGLSIFI